MGNGNDLEKASERLDTALRSIEDAVASQRKHELKNETLAERIESLESSVESERSSKEKLSDTNRQVSERIDKVIESIDEVLDGR